MVRLSLFTFVLLIGLSMIIAKNDLKYRKNQHKRFAQNNERTRTLRSLVGKLIDTETNILYNVDGQKLQDIPLKSDVTTTVVPLKKILIPTEEEIACLAACNTCVEEYSVENRKKRAADNCGPMCDCADSCFRMPVDQVAKIYAHAPNNRNEKDCWWRTYTEMLTSSL